MHPDSRQTVHIGINFVISPIPNIDKKSKRDFDKSLDEHGLDFTQVKLEEREIVVIRETPSRLEVKVATIGPGVGQLLILAPGQPDSDLSIDLFSKEAEAVVKAFEVTWPTPNRQVINSDITLRDLYQTSAEHAFLELWEVVLKQSSDKLSGLGRPVLGGGLRFVMPPLPTETEPIQIEVKIESFLRDTKKIFLETHFTWPQPLPSGLPISPESRLKLVDAYIEEKVTPFVTGESK